MEKKLCNYQPTQPDPFLQVLASPPKEDLRIMLFVGGAMISGVIVSSSNYFVDYIYQLRGDSTPDEWDTVFANQYAALSEKADKRPPDSLMGDYIHLKDVTTMIAAIVVELPFWRGRLVCVDAFSVGEFDLEEK